jgi:hypothetical protein
LGNKAASTRARTAQKSVNHQRFTYYKETNGDSGKQGNFLEWNGSNDWQWVKIENMLSTQKSDKKY